MHLVELISFALLPFIPSGEFIHISSGEMTNSLLFGGIFLGFNSIDSEMNKFSRKIFRREGETQVGKVDICSDAIYNSE